VDISNLIDAHFNQINVNSFIVHNYSTDARIKSIIARIKCLMRASNELKMH
jgi:hypothetical protein